MPTFNLPPKIRHALERYARDETGSATNARSAAWVAGLTSQEASDAVGEMVPELLAALRAQGLSLLDGGRAETLGPSRMQGRLDMALSDATPYLLAAALRDYWACDVTPAGNVQFHQQVQEVAAAPAVAAYLDKYWVVNGTERYSRDRIRARALGRLAETFSSATLRGFKCPLCSAALPGIKVRRRSEVVAALREPCACCQARLGQAVEPRVPLDSAPRVIPDFLRKDYGVLPVATPIAC